jgi:hypothetical protein
MLLLALAAALGPARLPPVDQCISDRSFVEYRTRLRQAIDRRDAKALLPLVADDVHASLGGHVGKKDFIELWRLDRPRSSKLWEELGEALALGCIIRGGVPTSPSFEDRLGDGRDPFEVRIAMPGAVLRRRPSDLSPAITRLRWHVLTLSGAWDGGPWVRVRLDDGRRGYVREALARSPIDYRAWFHKSGGRWVMAGFLAGD